MIAYAFAWLLLLTIGLLLLWGWVAGELDALSAERGNDNV